MYVPKDRNLLRSRCRRKMAADSGAGAILLLLTPSDGVVLKNDIPRIINSILQSEVSLADHEDTDDVFYGPYVALSAHYISSLASGISKTKVNAAAQACKILMKYLLRQLEKPNEQCPLTQLQIVTLIQSCCATSTGNGLNTNDVKHLGSLLKEAPVPINFASRVFESSGKPNFGLNFGVVAVKMGETNPGVPDEAKEAKRPRLDPSALMLEQLMAPIFDISVPSKSDTPVESAVDPDNDTTIILIPGPGLEVKSVLLAKNSASLQTLRGAEILLTVCQNLSYISHFNNLLTETLEGGAITLPSSLSESTQISNMYKSIMANVTIVSRVLSLPILEPLTEERLTKVVNIMLSCLYGSVAVTTASSIQTLLSGSSSKQAGSASNVNKDEDGNEHTAVTIVETTLETYNFIAMVIKKSTRAGGQALQNLHMIGSWLILSGLKHLLGLSTNADKKDQTQTGSAKTKTSSSSETQQQTPTKSSKDGMTRNLLKNQPAFGALCVALSSQALATMTSLFDDVKLEISMEETPMEQDGMEEDAVFQQQTQLLSLSNIGKSSTAWARIEKLKDLGLTNLLFSLTSASYRKAGMLKKIQKHPVDGDNFSTSDSNTYYEDDFSSSESSGDDDDDSEHILGLWFEETLAPRDSSSTATTPPPTAGEGGSVSGKSPQQLTEIRSLVPERGEPYGYIKLATKIVNFMNSYFLSSDNQLLKNYFSETLQDQQMVILAGIIRDLDKESSRSDKGTISIYFGATLGQLYDEFSSALARFLHNLLAVGINNEKLENGLLAQLGISPWTQESWPLQVYSRSLAVLAQILLLRLQMNKKELHVSTSEKTCVLIWKLLLGTLKNYILTSNSSTTVEEHEDINVEHAQILIFLFHNLQLMQKKYILLLTAQTIIEVSGALQKTMSDIQIVYLSRLLHFFEYMMKSLYDTPANLIEQIHWNLFNTLTNGKGPTTNDKENVRGSDKVYFPCKEVEDNYQKHHSSEDSHSPSEKPKFYFLMPVDINTQDNPKLDGFACSFILGSAETLKYSEFYEAILSLSKLGKQCDNRPNSEKLSYLGTCAIQYCSSVVFRLILLLPPSVESLERLADLNSISTYPINVPEILLYLIWVPRCGHKVFSGWLKDALVKQGLVTAKAEALLRKITKTLGTVNCDVELAKLFINLQPVSQNKQDRGILPGFLDLVLLECLLAKVQVSLDNGLSKPSNNDLSNEATKKIAEELLPIILQLAERYRNCIRWNILHQMKESAGIESSASSTSSTSSGEGHSQSSHAKSSSPTSPKALDAYNAALHFASVKSGKLLNFTVSVNDCLPATLRYLLDQWNAQAVPFTAWRNDCSSDIIPSESFISTVLAAHMTSLSNQPSFSVNFSLKRVLQSLVRFAGDLVIWFADKMSKDILNVMTPMLLDATTEYLVDYITLAVDKIVGAPDTDEFLTNIYGEALKWIYELLTEHSNKESNLNEHIFHECLKLMESMLDKPAGKKALEKFFSENEEKDIIDILLSAANGSLSPTYGTCVLKFFSRLFQQTEKNPNDHSLEKLRSSFNRMSKLNKEDSNVLQMWLSKVMTGTSTQQGEDGGSIQENRLLLQSLTSYIVKENSSVDEEVAQTILSALIPMGSQILSPASQGIGFSELMVIMATLAGAGSGYGHTQLFKASTSWLELCNKYLSQKDVLEKLEENIVGGKHQIMMESACYLLSYVADLVGSLKILRERSTQSPKTRAVSPPCEGEMMHTDMDSDWVEELGPDDDESPGEDSDEDSLSNKLCTFTVTQKEFMNQHWYHCHTCKMVDGVGVCTVCARVCHKDHDLTYAKYGSFFCDCGAKDDGTCQALTKRTVATATASGIVMPATSSSNAASASALNAATSVASNIMPFLFSSSDMNLILPSSLRRRPSSPTGTGGTSGAGNTSQMNSENKKCLDESSKHKQTLASQLEGSSEMLISHLNNANVMSTVLGLLQYLMPAVVNMCHRHSPMGNSSRIQQSLQILHQGEKAFEQTDQLMVPTLGSQEGAFENVRMNYTGEHGQTIRQLITAHMIRRVAMCCLVTPQGKRQHLAVSHEKGKITLLQLSALLKQADSSKRKLTLTISVQKYVNKLQRLGSAPVPFTVLSIAGNNCNEDFLAVCGLRDCHVLTFTSTGSVAEHLVLHPQLESGNYIIKAVWLPGSQTELAVVTADFVKIYDLAKDTLSPQYFLLLPSGKIRDCCFVFTEESQCHLMIMSSAGHIYAQPLSEESSARHGPFYVTNILDVQHPEIKHSNGTVNGGGVAIYYSHSLQLLLFSYVQGKNFLAPFPTMKSEITTLFLIQMKSTTPTTSSAPTPSSIAANNGNNCTTGANKPGPQPLCQFTEVPHHPGLILAQLQTSNNTVILMVKPDVVLVQEIKFLSTKSKITDMVAVRHVTSSGEMRTTLILLCEDGSLRIYMASPEQTSFWLTPTYHLSGVPSKSSKKKKSTKIGKPSSSVSFPVDFFEHCTAMSDIEFGGNDILQIYNSQQVKHRLNTAGLYIASTKLAGFNVEIVNTDNSMVMVGVRIMVGSQDINRAPSYIEIFGRNIQVNLTRSRWFDIPFTHEESLSADKTFSIFFGVSSDASGVTMVDSIKVYGKTKESFGWPDDSEDVAAASGTSAGGPIVCMDAEGIPTAPLPLTPLDRLVGSSLEVLEGCFSVFHSPHNTPEENNQIKSAALDLATQLLILPIPPGVQQHVKNVLAALHSTRTAYTNHKDEALLSYVIQSLKERTAVTNENENQSNELDGEAFYRLVSIARGVAINRPANLVKFAEGQQDQGENGSSSGKHFMVRLTDAFWALHSQRPQNPALAPVSRYGLFHIDATVQALVEVIHALTLSSLDCVPLATSLYAQLLLAKDTTVSFAAKQALVRVLRSRTRRRRVFIPSPPHCSSPGETQEMEMVSRMPNIPQSASQGNVAAASNHPPHHQEEADAQYEIVEALEPMVLLSGDSVEHPVPQNIEALIAGNSGFHLLDIPPDADDETMVELAIALSLQDQPNRPDSLCSRGPQRASSLEGGHFSDTTASANASDDEGSTAATDGSTLRTSPAEQGGSAGSESGGSGVDSIGGDPTVSGRSSMYGDHLPEAAAASGVRSETSSVGAPSTTLPQETESLDVDVDQDAGSSGNSSGGRLHSLRLAVLDKLLTYIPKLRGCGGVNAVPFMQTLLMLSSDLDGEDERDRSSLATLLSTIISELNMSSQDATKVGERTPQHEVQLILMRFLSILMSRVKGGSGKSASATDVSNFCSTHTAVVLLSSGVVDFCLSMLEVLLNYWKNFRNDDKLMTVGNALLKPHPVEPLPDMSPFFLKQYVKGHASDIFEAYPQLLTEMVLRLPYQIKRMLSTLPSAPPLVFSQTWYTLLCEYMMMQQTPFVRRQVRKLLLFICGSKDKYRQLRDFHALDAHMKNVKAVCKQGGLPDFVFEAGTSSRSLTSPSSSNVPALTLTYDSLIAVIEHLKACTEIATSRIHNWQKFCQKDETILSFLMSVSFLLNEGVSPIILQLLQVAVCGSKAGQNSGVTTPQATSSPSKHKKDKDKLDVEEESNQKLDDSLCGVLAQQINKFVDRNLFLSFLQFFLLESNSTSVRWQAHSLILHLFRNSSVSQQENILDLMWYLWPRLPAYGRKAAQFVDLVGYFTLTSPETRKDPDYLEKALQVLRDQNQLLMNHPNSNIYNSLQGLVEFDGFFLESEPCLVCNNPEVSYSNIKLSSIKVDSRFTTTTQIVKLIGSHSISKITLRIGDLKRNKMVRTINFYYNNRSVQSVVELKNRPSIWNKAKQCNLTASQSELKVEFPLPIVACNLMIEYADFYENIQASSETLQCPRCSASVPANPGVCANCGENVFQCHKCRAINYDEKDPFLCNSCGFCKYAKFDYTLTAKPCCAVDPIENEEDRKKAIGTINNLLEKADRVYKQLIGNKPMLEQLLLRIHEHGMSDRLLEESGGNVTVGSVTSSVGSNNVNRAIHQLAQRYCTDCRASFDELSKLVQKVLASRKELVEYERQNNESCKVMASAQSVENWNKDNSSSAPSGVPIIQGRCYGCASAAVEQCITLLRAVATSNRYRHHLCTQGLIRELVEYNLHRGTVQVRHEVRQLLCLLTRDNARATTDLNTLLMDKIATAVKGHLTSPDLAIAVRHEVALLANSLQKEDSCWEQRLRCVIKLFLMGVNAKSPVVMESITLPCLKILQMLIKINIDSQASTKTAPEKSNVETLGVGRASSSLAMQVHIDLQKWLNGDPNHTYRHWKQRVPAKSSSSPTGEVPIPAAATNPPFKRDKAEVRQLFLMEKYGLRWLDKIRGVQQDIELQKSNWLQYAMFSSSSRAARLVACSLVEALCQVPVRKKAFLDLLTTYLDELGTAGESAAEFLTLYQNLISPTPWKYYLTLKGLLPHLGELVTKEIERLTHLEETTLSSDLSQGYALKMLTELLASFIEVDSIRQLYKSRLVGCVLNGYLCLRKLVVQRTKLVDETQEKLLELLEDMTTGTEVETHAFMSVCVETIKKYNLSDLRTPVFIFERLCSVIYPEENDIGEFFITLEKDPQQEDFLQGRMLGNPYSSNDVGMGPLMRDVKNKICQDCELVALLEDDNGMELLVCNKIISLDLPVKDVYKKIWCSENGEAESMRVVYRMRGLLGDATEEFIQNLDSKDNEEVDNEELFKLAGVMSKCGGLEAMLERLGAISDLSRGRPLLMVLLKLFGFCIKVKSNRQKLTDPAMSAISVFLKTLKIALSCENQELIQGPPGSSTIPEQLLNIMESILVEASLEPIERYATFCATCGTKEDIHFFLSSITNSVVRSTANLQQRLMRVIPFLTLGDKRKMSTLIGYFEPYLNFNKFDYEHTSTDSLHLECFCMLTAGIERNHNGNQLKDLMVTAGIVDNAMKYLTLHSPPIKSALCLVAFDDWKEFTSKPALKYVLRLLTGLSHGHESTALLVSAECIPIFHRLEQVSSDERVGSLAENLLDAIKENKSVAEKIEDVRKQTRDEKKRLAMAMREKQLGALGMRTNEKGQVTAHSSLLQKVEELGDEAGLVCIICREGYRFQPTKVLGIYTFTKRCLIEENQARSSKSAGYTTVTHFNVVHVDCHMAAVRHARGRDEWESAALQNANTKCNGLLPLWGPQVTESGFASCLARHNTYLQESTGHRDIGYVSTIHDLQLLLLRFAQEKSFSEESGGGGPQSNIHLIPYLIHMALYVLNTTRSATREEKNLNTFLEMPPNCWVENSYEVEGVHYWMCMAVHLFPPSKWQEHRLYFLRRLLIMAHVRSLGVGPHQGIKFDSEPNDYSVYKPALIFYGLIDLIYSHLFKRVTVTLPESWPTFLADFIRHNDQPLLEAGDKMLLAYQEELLPCQSLAEFCDVVGIVGDIPDADDFLNNTLHMPAAF